MVFCAISMTSHSETTNDGTQSNTGPLATLGFNWINFDNDRLLEDKGDAFLGLGYQLNNHWALGIEYTDIDTHRDWLNGSDFDINLWSLNTTYRYQQRGEDSFFWKAGFGKYSKVPYNSNDEMLRLGAGYDFILKNNLSLTVGADALVRRKDSRTDFVPYAGLTYFFAQKPPKAPAVKVVKKDSDNDGIYDQSDECPNTKAGIAVDAKGCDIDLDKDGVNNTIDKCPDTPRGAKVDATGCRIILTKDVSIKLNVKFANNSAEIQDEYASEIRQVADFMLQYPDTNVVIEGHTDSDGSAKYNQQLSQKRADSVMLYLVEKFNVDQNRIKALGKGESAPVADNNTREGKALNRRVQAEITTTVRKPQ